jgi:hypothetical protein
MPVEMLNYRDLGQRLGTSPEAARALSKRLRLRRQLGNDGKTCVAVDFAEISHKPKPVRSPAGQRPDDKQTASYAALTAKVAELEDQIAHLEIAAGRHRADFEHERERCDRQRQQNYQLRERCDQFMGVLLRQASDLMKAREAATRFECELTALKLCPWWRRLTR